MTQALDGIGVGLRIEFAKELFDDPDAPITFIEIHPENFVDRGGAHATMLERSLGRFPLLTHGLTMGFGNAEPPSTSDLERLRSFLDRVRSPLHSDHFCFGAATGRSVHELLPLPHEEQTIELATERMLAMREALGRPVAIENVSYYVPRSLDPLDEIEVLREILERSDGHLLLDVNNVVVNAHNHGFDPRDWLARVPMERVAQIHVAGHFVRHDGLRIDTHGTTSSDEVRTLLGEVLSKTGPVPVLLERDADFPTYAELRDELVALGRIYDGAMKRRALTEAPRALEVRAQRDATRTATRARPEEPLRLPELQIAVIDHLLELRPLPVGSGLVAERWHLYRRMARGRLHDLAVGVFARTRTHLGSESFDRIFDAWLHQGGPSSPIFWRTADEFGTFALARPEFEPRARRDLLRLEQTEWRLRHAPYPPASRFGPLRFDGPAVLSPALELLDVDHAVHDSELSTDTLQRRAPSTLAVFRRADDSISVLALNPLASALLLALRAPHESITAALQQVARGRALNVTPSLLESIATTFAQWHELGLLLGTRRVP